METIGFKLTNGNSSSENFLSNFFLFFPKNSFGIQTNILTFAPPFIGKSCLIYKLISVDTLSYKTVSANKNTVEKQWVLVDAEGETLGRLASKVAIILRGKNKPNYTPHVDCGDNVIVVNAEKVQLTGTKMQNKTYIRHTGYPGGQRSLTATELMEKNPIGLVEKAVKGMLPKNKLGSAIYRNLIVYAGAEHGQEAQKPTVINLKDFR